MTPKIRFGVLGCSKVALKNVLPALAQAENCESAFLGSRDPAKAKEISVKYGVAGSGTYEEVLADKEVDAIYVSLPNALHEEWSIRALEAGKHVICEKPAALTYASAKKMVDAAKKNKRRLMEGLMFRYHPQHQRAQELIKTGVLGGLLRFDSCFSFPMPDPKDNLVNKELGGGSLNYVAPYPICASRMIFEEEPESVWCKMEFDPINGVDYRADMILNYRHGKTALISTIFGAYFQSTYSVLGSQSQIRMGRAYAMPRDMSVRVFLDRNDRTEEIGFGSTDQFRLMLNSFAGGITTGEAPDYENDLLAQARVLEALRRSAGEKRLINMADIN